MLKRLFFVAILLLPVLGFGQGRVLQDSYKVNEIALYKNVFDTTHTLHPASYVINFFTRNDSSFARIKCVHDNLYDLSMLIYAGERLSTTKDEETGDMVVTFDAIDFRANASSMLALMSNKKGHLLKVAILDNTSLIVFNIDNSKLIQQNSRL